MKLRVQKSLIESILINLQSFIEKKDATQITSHILVEAQNDYVVLKATDKEMGLRIINDQAFIEHPGSFTAHGKKLLDIIRILKDNEITLEVLDSQLYIKQKQTKFKLPTFDPLNFPSFPVVDEKATLILDSKKLIMNLKKISPAIDTNNPKFELNGALINIKDQSTDLVGTDTKRLAIATIDEGNNNTFSLIIPKKAILEIQKLFLDTINIYYDETNFIIKNENYYFFTRLINGKFPDYERIIPQKLKIAMTLPKKEIIEAIKMITTISNEIKMTFYSDKIDFQSLGDGAEAKTEIPLQTGINDRFEIAFNSRFFLDAITQIEEENFEIGFNEPNLPFVIKKNNFMTIIMPIVV